MSVSSTLAIVEATNVAAATVSGRYGGRFDDGPRGSREGGAIAVMAAAPRLDRDVVTSSFAVRFGVLATPECC
jgi:hypothetical protein